MNLVLSQTYISKSFISVVLFQLTVRPNLNKLLNFSKNVRKIVSLIFKWTLDEKMYSHVVYHTNTRNFSDEITQSFHQLERKNNFFVNKQFLKWNKEEPLGICIMQISIP